MLDKLLGSPAISMLERTLSFTERRHEILLENIANASTPGYVQKDVSVKAFQRSLQEAVTRRQEMGGVEVAPQSSATVEFEPNSSRVALKPQPIGTVTPFHDGGARSPEVLMGQLLDNGQAHNLAAAFLKNRYETLRQAISMKV